MATAHATIRIVEFVILDDISHCNVFYESDEPGTPWGGGWKTKSFGVKTDAREFMKKELSNYIMWKDGREKYKP